MVGDFRQPGLLALHPILAVANSIPLDLAEGRSHAHPLFRLADPLNLDPRYSHRWGLAHDLIRAIVCISLRR